MSDEWMADARGRGLQFDSIFFDEMSDWEDSTKDSLSVVTERSNFLIVTKGGPRPSWAQRWLTMPWWRGRTYLARQRAADVCMRIANRLDPP